MWPKVAGSDEPEFDVTVCENSFIYLSSAAKKNPLPTKALPLMMFSEMHLL
jgi:hypothetical protein